LFLPLRAAHSTWHICATRCTPNTQTTPTASHTHAILTASHTHANEIVCTYFPPHVRHSDTPGSNINPTFCLTRNVHASVAQLTVFIC
jgi:hypothetical protein